MSKTTHPRPELLSLSESPIEDLMTMALVAVGFGKCYGCNSPHYDDGYMFWPQVQIGKYRADFVVGYRGNCVTVEVDGHEWHEKTKEQAARDKARDRYLTAKGYPVMRFTGSEVYADALGCAQEVLDCVMGSS